MTNTTKNLFEIVQIPLTISVALVVVFIAWFVLQTTLLADSATSYRVEVQQPSNLDSVTKLPN